ncbi:hypothetical protein [Sphingomonas kyeonggiensis]|uniref:Uncharacterized protein n=1 Tax=Sphingomonas kyeonggiensis TaxID=1268553 RepID=A0A7W6NWH4_9SPHN|nr:hypothetical protein [Sphingomonas kyeonggiensis]MBB4098602.1 hypothetical protein [Sphingomonas kyeonggiensis]
MGPLTRFILRRVHETIGYIPVHLPALTAEQDFVGAEPRLPLIVLWGEEDRGDHFAFRTWVNWGRVVEIAREYEGPDDGSIDAAQVRAELAQAYQAIQTVSTAAIYDLAGDKGRRPSQVCDAYWNDTAG